MSMIQQQINEKYGKREVTRTVDWNKGQAAPSEPSPKRSINWENGTTQHLDSVAPEPQPLPA